MKLWTALFLLLSVVSGVLSAKSTPDKFARYQSLSRSGPVDLDSASYEELTSEPRDYFAVVILTATDARFGCLLCRDFEPEWDLIARSWNKGTKPDDLKVVYGTLDFDNGKAVFQKVGNLTGTYGSCNSD
jgi:oligosaccharyltransferase complex subunit gamma